MTKNATRSIVQTWKCEECGKEYNSEVSIISIVCSNKHKAKNMKLVSGEPNTHVAKGKLQRPKRVSERPPVEPEPPVPSRPKVQRVTNTQLLLEAFGIEEK